MPPWHSKTQPKPLYENWSALALWDVLAYADGIEVRANRIDARIVYKELKRVLAIKWAVLGWITAKWKAQKYGPLMWELREITSAYQVKQYNTFIDVLGGYSADVSLAVKNQIVTEKSTTILQRMQRSDISNRLNIARSFNVLA